MDRRSLFQSGSEIQQAKKTISLTFYLTDQFLCSNMDSRTISLRSLSFLSSFSLCSASSSISAQLLGPPAGRRSDFFIQQEDMIYLQLQGTPHYQNYCLFLTPYYNNFTTCMDLKSYNKALFQSCKKAFNFAFILDIDPADEETIFCNDTDTVKYKLLAKKNSLALYFYFTDLQNVWRYIENYFRATYYQNFSLKLVQVAGELALEIALNNEGFTALHKSFVPPQEVGVTTDRRKFDPLIEVLSKRLASIKRHFLASPFQIMIEAARLNASDKGNREVPRFSFYLKPDRKQKVWLAFEKNQLTVYFGLHFEDKFEQQLGKIFFSQLVDAKKHVQNSPAVSISDRQLPRLLVESFPQEKTQKYAFANGIVSFTIFGNLVRNHRAMASYLAGFRNYAYYHIQSWKCYLHSRVLRRIGIILRDLSQAKIEPFAQA